MQRKTWIKQIRWAAVTFLVVAMSIGAKTLIGNSSDDYETIVVERGDIEATVSAIGTLKPRYQVAVGARVSGQIDRLHVKAGDVVTKGQLLAELDPRLPQATVNAGRAELANLNAKLVEQRAQLELAAQQQERQQQMFKEESTRLEDLQIAIAEYKTAAARIDQLQAQIVQTQSTLSGNEAELDYTRIYAPIAGTVISINAEEGQTLNATYETPTLMHIADLSSMTVWAEISEADIRKVHVGIPVHFTTLGGAGRQWRAQVRQVLPAPAIPEGKEQGTALAPSSRKVILYTALFDIDNSDGALMPQMTAQISFVTASAKQIALVPLPALTPISDRTDLYTARVINPAGRLEEREIKVGVRTRLSAEVIAGLLPGEQLVTGEREKISGPRRLQW